FTLADEDRAELGIAGDSRSLALPLVTRPRVEAPRPRTIAVDAGLIGTWTWQPNRIGLEWFLGEVVPRLPAGFTIRIAGAMPKDLAAPTPAIEFVGRVGDADDFLRQAAVVPLVSTAGSGVQLKTIEAFEAGYPVVATSRSLRGISFRPDNCVIADDPAEFAEELAAMAARRLPLADGRDFHARQIAELDARMARGLAALTRSGRAAA
ncbi:MAG: glycosyltransferase family 4 protein, partial [Rhizobiaceae bacterium]